MAHLAGYEDIVWCSSTKFGSGVAKAIVWRIATDGATLHANLDYAALADEHEFSEGEIQNAVGHLVTRGFARIVDFFPPAHGPALLLLTPGRQADEAAEADLQRAKAARRAEKIALRGGQEYRAAISPEIRDHVFHRDGHACRACGTTEDLTLDHVHPWSVGGPDTADNLQVLCRPCNSSKGDRVA